MKKKSTSPDTRSTSPDPLPDPRPNVPIRTREEKFMDWGAGVRFASREILLSRLGGAKQVHVNLLIVPAGKQGGPFHYHMREEEHFYVVDGRCILRSGDDRHDFQTGDYACFPAGTGVPHAFENPFDADCTMISIGPSDPDEIAVYPDSGKAKLRSLDTIVPFPQETLDYWDGEPVDDPLPSD